MSVIEVIDYTLCHTHNPADFLRAEVVRRGRVRQCNYYRKAFEPSVTFCGLNGGRKEVRLEEFCAQQQEWCAFMDENEKAAGGP